jgi:hypothetical protein
MKRREFLAGAAGAAVLSATAGQAAAQSETELSAYDPPAHVTISYDEQRLKTYRPWLDLSALDSKPYALYGQVVESPEYEFDVLVYAARYAIQEGISDLQPPLTDSHFGDTEFMLVYLNDQGEVAEVVYTVYHWTADRVSGDAIPMYDGDHVSATVVNPWHNYILRSGISGTFVNLRDMTDDTDGLQSWLRNGMAANLKPGCLRDPETMLSRGHFWKSGWDARYAELFHTLIEPLPFFDVPSSDSVQ